MSKYIGIEVLFPFLGQMQQNLLRHLGFGGHIVLCKLGDEGVQIKP